MQAYRSAIIHFLQDPYQKPLIAQLMADAITPDSNNTSDSKQVNNVIKNDIFEYYPDGLLVVDQDGKVVKVGIADELIAEYPTVPITVYENALLAPGFIDTHSHMPQTEMVGAYGEQLLEWLQRYTFPTEAKFADRDLCANVIKVYLTNLLRNGTTTANVFCTVHKHSAEIFFEHCLKLNLRMIAGKVLMDRMCPENLQDTAISGYEDSKELIEKYHNNGRCLYSITPRFAPTSTDEQLQLAGQLYQEYKDKKVHMHTHLSENLNEIKWVSELFPNTSGYLDVYDSFNLIGERCTFAHCVHLTESEQDRLAETGSSISFCPTSNLFLGSGLFNLDKAQDKGIRVGMGTDTAGGTSFNVGFTTMSEAYKVMQLQSKKLDPYRSFYLTTLGGAKSLYIDDKVGNFEAGKEADFVVIDLKGTPYYEFRRANSDGKLHDLIFTLTTLGDDRMVKATYAMGKKVWDKDQEDFILGLFQE